MSKKLKKILIIVGIIIVAVIVVVALQQGATVPVEETQGLVVPANINVPANKAAELQVPEVILLGPVFTINNNVVTPKSFMVEYPSDASVTFVSADNEAHSIVFASEKMKTPPIDVAAGETKKVNFKTPEPGQYILSCNIPGHKERGETAEIIVSEKATSSSAVPSNLTETRGNEVPGANLLISEGVIAPTSFSVAAELPVSLTVNSGDKQAHNIVFSDSNLGIANLNVSAGSSASINFTAPKAGVYTFKCDVPGHVNETGKLIVK